MNPLSLSALIDPIEKFITEHGSAAILREHLSLLKTQSSTLEKENTELKTKIQILETENQKLKTDNEELGNKIQQYEKLKSEDFNKSIPFQKSPI